MFISFISRTAHDLIVISSMSAILVFNTLKTDSHIMRHDAARHDAVRQDAAKMHDCCSHMQRLQLEKQYGFEQSGSFARSPTDPLLWEMVVAQQQEQQP